MVRSQLEAFHIHRYGLIGVLGLVVRYYKEVPLGPVLQTYVRPEFRLNGDRK